MNRMTAAAIGAGVLVLGGIVVLFLPAETTPLDPASPAPDPPAPVSPEVSPSLPPEVPLHSAPVEEEARPAKEAGTIAGRVLRGPGRTPVAGVEVRFSTEPGRGSPVVRTVVSGPDGTYRVTGLPPGRLSITSEGNETASGYRGTVTLSAGAGLEGFDILLFPVGAVEGRVTGTRGEPISGLTVKAENLGNRRSSTTTTDLDGTYRFARFPTGYYSISFVDGRIGVRRGRMEVLEGKTGRLDFPGGASVVGTVTGDDRAPLTGVVVHVERWSWSPGAPPILQCRAVSDAKGEFRMECLEPGPCEVHVEVQGQGGFLSLPFPVEVRTGENRIPIDLGRGELRGVIAGKVRMPGGSPPGPETRFTVLLSGSPHENGRATWGRPNLQADGSFRIGGVPAGTYRLTVTGEWFEFRPWEQEITLGSGVRKEGILVDMVRTPVGRVRFTVMTESGTKVESPMVGLVPADNRAYFKVEKQEPGACTVSAQAGTRTFFVRADGVGWAHKVLEVKEGEDADAEVVLNPEKPAR